MSTDGPPKLKIQRLGSYVLLCRDGQILLSRLSTGWARGMWTLPGGGVEFGEHPEDAAARETLEETGYVVQVGPLRKINHAVEEGERAILHHIQFFYEAKIVGGELTAEVDGSTDGAQWFSLEEAESLPKVGIVSLALNLLN